MNRSVDVNTSYLIICILDELIMRIEKVNRDMHSLLKLKNQKGGAGTKTCKKEHEKNLYFGRPGLCTLRSIN